MTRGAIELDCCQRCGHVYNSAFDPSLLEYGSDYENALHHSPHFQAFAEDLVDRLRAFATVAEGGLVVDVGCGDGHFLELFYRRSGAPGLGFDPSLPQAKQRRAEGAVELTNSDHVGDHRLRQAQLVTCRHVLEHIESPGPFLDDLRGTLPTGTAVYFEVPNLRAILRDLSVWDLIYEHCGYFSRESLEYLFASHGFEGIEVEEAFGGQYLGLTAQAGKRGAATADVAELLQEARAFAPRFADRLQRTRETFEDASGGRAVLWGAGSKGVALLNALSIGHELDCVVDLNPKKHGRFTPGTGHEVVAPESLRERSPETVWITNPLYRVEIRKSLDDLGLTADIRVL
ncbi:MAG: class I SAM-dependent methyltransferase [Acidobacteriota bacterium]